MKRKKDIVEKLEDLQTWIEDNWIYIAMPIALGLVAIAIGNVVEEVAKEN